jgi:asparagine synthase (glutamine-hydrolysing)
MASTIRHRGPDDGGTWVDADAGVALGHRRLAVIDLSAAGHQPMQSPSGRYVITYNGEIYNFKRLSKELVSVGHTFWGHSDTEVLLRAIEQWGLDVTLPKLNGMFAFAVWDRVERTLHLARDRIGEKPLYYGWCGSTFLFGSELKALRAHPDFRGEIDRDVLALYLRRNCVPGSHSIYRGITKLPPATSAALPASAGPGFELRPVPYWRLSEVVEHGAADPSRRSPVELVDELESLLLDAIKIRMQADVPLGAFLSGGIDSSTVVALMQAQSRRPVKSFTIGFEEAAYDESLDAARVARHLGTEHVALRVTAKEAQQVIPLLPRMFDEPFSDSSQIPTYLVSQMTREHVTVSLSGDGGDELFGGYNRYTWCSPIWQRIGPIPSPLRRGSAALLSTIPPSFWDTALRRMESVLPERFRIRNPGASMQKLTEVLPARNIEEMYQTLISHWKRPEEVVLGTREAGAVLTGTNGRADIHDPVALMMYLDTVTYLPDDILVKVDRATMATSLEARVPYLDHRVIESAWRLPMELKVSDGQGKGALRQVLYRHVPAALVERPKTGFGLPIDSWLRGPLREWAEDLLDEHHLSQEGFLDPAPIRRVWAEHLAGRHDWQHHLWDVLMFEAWIRDRSDSCQVSQP